MYDITHLSNILYKTISPRISRPHAIARNIQYLNLTNKSKCAMYEALIRISQACPAMYKYTFTTIDIYDVIFLRSCHDTNDDLSI